MKTLTLTLSGIMIGTLAHAADHEMGFGNPIGTQDTYDAEARQWELLFDDPDGSYDPYRTGDRELDLRFENPDGSEDTFRIEERRRWRLDEDEERRLRWE